MQAKSKSISRNYPDASGALARLNSLHYSTFPLAKHAARVQSVAMKENNLRQSIVEATKTLEALASADRAQVVSSQREGKLAADKQAEDMGARIDRANAAAHDEAKASREWRCDNQKCGWIGRERDVYRMTCQSATPLCPKCGGLVVAVAKEEDK